VPDVYHINVQVLNMELHLTLAVVCAGERRPYLGCDQ